MKLSEAILLGSSMLAPRAGKQHFAETQEGCALGMAAVARGCKFHTWTIPFEERDRRTLGVEGVWGEWVLAEVERPCDCWRIWIPRKKRIKDIIAHLFDYHIMNKRNWTLEQLVAWVQTVEPKEIRPKKSPPFVFRQPMPPSIQLERLRQEAAEWQAVCYAFEARRALRSSLYLRRDHKGSLPN